MRVTTAFNRLLCLPGLVVDAVVFTDAGIVVAVKRTFRRLTCPCGFSTSATYDRSRRRWRHLDLGTHKLWLEGEIRRLRCIACDRVRTEDVPWARPGARQTRAFEDLAAFLAQRMDRTAVGRLLRCAWQTVTDLVGRVVRDHRATDQLDGLVRIGVDEIGYRRNRQFLTVVADHDTGRVVWVGDGKRREALTSFFDALGPQRCAQLKAVSMDMGRAYVSATSERLPHAAICLDAFHLIKWAGEALDRVFRSHTLNQEARRWRHSRYLLRSSPEKLTTIDQVELLRLRRKHEEIGRAYELKEGLRDLFRSTPPERARMHLNGWIGDARTSGIPAFELLARRITKHYDGIINSLEHGLSNSRLEGINAKIRLINARGYGHHSVDSLATMIYLNLGGISIKLPTET